MFPELLVIMSIVCVRICPPNKKIMHKLFLLYVIYMYMIMNIKFINMYKVSQKEYIYVHHKLKLLIYKTTIVIFMIRNLEVSTSFQTATYGIGVAINSCS